MDNLKGEQVIRFLGRRGPQINRVRNLIRSLFLGFVFMAASVFSLMLFGATTSLHCERVETNYINCSREQSWFGLYTREQPPVNDLSGADIQMMVDDDDDSRTYRVVLKASGGEVPLTTAYSSGYEKKAELASDVNDFVADPTRQILDVDSGTPWIGILVSGLMMAGGISMLAVGLLRGGRPFGRRQLAEPFAGYVQEENGKKDFWD